MNPMGPAEVYKFGGASVKDAAAIRNVADILRKPTPRPLAQADLMVKEGFLNTASRALLMSTSDIHQLLPMLVSFKPPTSDKWANTRR